MAIHHPMLQPYEPSPADPFDRVKAAHLLNRAGFGGTSAEIDAVLKLGPQAAVDALLRFPDASADEQDPKDVPNLSAIDGLPNNFRELRRQLASKSKPELKQLRMKFQMANHQAMDASWAWWIKRMIDGPHPLQEKLTLFWHGHFTTSFREERSALLMWEQNELLRKMAAGNFRDFVHAISRDPAMLDYLNNAQNRKDHPNENYARELMELFTLGIGNYTENDIKQAARAFTGWMHDGDQFVFNARQHDEGVKTFFNKIGNFNGDEVIDIILAHPACPRFIASEMWAFFVHPDPEPALIESFAQQFRDAKFELRPILRTMLTSKAFYSADSIGVQIKSPVQLVIGTLRALDVTLDKPERLRGPLQLMGQVPMAPPNVKGWPGGHAWINASTIFARYNTAVRLVDSAKVDALVGADSAKGEAAVDALVNRLIQRPIEASQRQVLVDAYKSVNKPDQAIKRVAELIVSMPEYQLC